MIYNIIWIDDEHDSMDAFKRDSLDNGLKLYPFKSMNGGCKELEENFVDYDAVLLDAKFLENETDSKGTEDTKWVHRTKERLLKIPKHFDIIVLTGQAKTYSSDEFNNAFPKVFEKGNSDDNEKLFKELIAAAKSQKDAQIRHEYSNVFEVAQTIDNSIKSPLMEILKEIKNPSGPFNDVLYFTQLRKILELVFRNSNKAGLLHDKCVQKGGSQSQVNLSEASLFLSGFDTKYLKVKCTKPHFPKLISDSVKNIIFITGSASHTSDKTIDNTSIADVSSYRNYIKTPYLLFSLTYQLMDILIWFNNYKIENPDIEKNKKLWENIAENDDMKIKGKVSKVSENGFGTFEPEDGNKELTLPPSMVEEHNLKLHQKIEVLTFHHKEKDELWIEKVFPIV